MDKSVRKRGSERKLKIGILGGTFDPIHLGHLALARHAKDQFHLGKVFFIPAFIPPHKAARRGLTPAPYRYRMVELAIQGQPDFEISDSELNRLDISYTVDTLRELEKRYPRGEFYLIVGSDLLTDISGWHESAELVRKVKFLAAKRVEKKANHLLPSGKIAWIEMPPFEISSSEIRSRIQQGESAGKWLPAGVEAYIREMKLYRDHP